MAETHATGEANITVREEPLILTQQDTRMLPIGNLSIIRYALETLGLTPPTVEEYTRLVEAFNRFKRNRALWASDEWKDHVVLMKHAAFTLFVPAGKASRARIAVEDLEKAAWFQGPSCGGTGWDLTADGERIKANVRFYKTKIMRLRYVLDKWFDAGGLREMALHHNPSDFRKVLMNTYDGYGMKASAHFMRNTGLGNLPIIAVHIMKALEAWNFKRGTYEEAETSFIAAAKLLQVGVPILDACLWCAYAKNWNISQSDFDNFENTTKT